MNIDAVLHEPELRPFLPLLYVAWADGDLDAAQRKTIEDKIAARPWLKPRLRDTLQQWLSSSTPPDATSLARLRTAIVEAAQTMSPIDLHSFGQIASSLGDVDAETRRIVDELEHDLGVDAATLRVPVEQPVDAAAARFTDHASFDVDGVKAVLDGRFAATRERARAFLADPPHRALYGVDKDRHREQVYAWLKELADAGFGALAFPGVTTDAGADGDNGLGHFLVSFETLGYGDLSLVVKYGVQFGLWGGSVYFLGNDEQRQKYLPKVASLQAPGCFAMSEVGHGSNVADLETVVVWDDDKKQLRLHTPSESARKDWAGNAALHAKYATVFAQLEVKGVRHGVHAFVVPIRDDKGEPLPGIRIGDCGHKLGLNGVDNGRLWFDQVLLPRDALLGRYASIDDDGTYTSPIESPNKRFFTMLGTLVGGRLGVAASGLSAAKLGLTIALRYATARRQFGATSAPETLLLEYPSHQRRLLPHLAATYAFHFAIDEVREQFLAKKPDADTRTLEAEVAGIKAGATWHVTQTLQACREACGGQGYLSVNRLADARADTDIFTTFEGDNTVLMQLLAKGLLTGFQQRFSDLGVFKLAARHVAGQVALTNPIASRNVDETTLRDADHQLRLLEFREATILHAAARRVQTRLRKKVDQTLAFNEVQEHLLALAAAHVDVVSLRAFIDGVRKATGRERDALDRLRQLHGLVLLERHADWFYENGVFEPVRGRAVRKLVPKLFTEVLPDAVAL
ncbi:MAG TPA: acyl-CoA dehydrogenase, partial [Myxococcota bacterium]